MSLTQIHCKEPILAYDPDKSRDVIEQFGCPLLSSSGLYVLNAPPMDKKKNHYLTAMIFTILQKMTLASFEYLGDLEPKVESYIINHNLHECAFLA